MKKRGGGCERLVVPPVKSSGMEINMNQFLVYTVVLLLLVVIIGYFNEKVTGFTYEISLMLFSIIIIMSLLFVNSVVFSVSVVEILNNCHKINLEAFLMDGVLLLFTANRSRT